MAPKMAFELKKMKQPAFYIVTALLLGISATAQVKTGAPQNKKFADALEAQVSCGRELEPVKAIRALQKAGIISKSQYIVVDSINYFKVKRPLTVFGFKVQSVLGFDEAPKIFARGPGTSPGILLGIIIPLSVVEVKSKLKDSAQKLTIEEAQDDDFANQNKSRLRTQVICFGER